MPRGGKREGAGRKPSIQKPVLPPRKMPDLSVIDGIEEPDWSTQFTDELDQALAHRHWLVITNSLRHSEKLANENAGQIKRLVDAYVLYEIALRHVAEEGAVFPRK